MSALMALTEGQRRQALQRFGLLCPALDEGVPLAAVARGGFRCARPSAGSAAIATG
jgi:hypothetical protein